METVRDFDNFKSRYRKYFSVTKYFTWLVSIFRYLDNKLSSVLKLLVVRMVPLGLLKSNYLNGPPLVSTETLKLQPKPNQPRRPKT